MYTNDQLRQLFQSKFNLQDWNKFVLDVIKPQTYRQQPEKLDLDPTEGQGYFLGQKTADNFEIGLFYVETNSSVKRRRVGLRQLIRPYLRYLVDAALVVFDDGDNWRLSFICDLKDERTQPKRYTFVFGEQTNYYNTAVKRFVDLQGQGITFETLKEAFSVEALTKEFYEKLYHWYLWAVDSKTGVTFPNKIETDTDDRENINRKMIRLITRMLFVWFIKQKHLIPNNLFDIDFLKTILRDFDEHDPNSGIYYNAILQNLFFATLNQEIPDRAFSRGAFQGKSTSFTIKNLYRDSERQSWFTFSAQEKEQKVMELFKNIPYLNGGLFDCLDKYTLDETGEKLVPLTYYDGFSSRDSKSPNGNLKYRAFIPNTLFFAQEHEETITTEGGRQVLKVEGLLNIFKQYNFTVEENSPNDTEISLDPELLGRVFENLLAAYNPETQESARKSTGSFYTPRGIVDYMVDEAIKSYLIEQCHHDTTIVETLFNEHLPQIENDIAQKISHDLYSIKVLDPACGSGAFPMGFLLRLVELIEKLTPKEQFNKYNTKLQIIKNCIYGIDIQPIAMLICKLRFFISLICDSEKDDSKENFGIMPLPSLETKFVAANSLLSAEVKRYDDDWTQDEHLQQLKQELLDLRIGVINIRKHKDKLGNLRKDKQKCDEIEQYIIAHSSQSDEEKIARMQRDIATLEQQLEQYRSECWVEETVAQTSLFDIGEPSIFRRDINKDKRESILSQIKTCKATITKEQNKNIPTGFEAAVRQVTTEWNPYDQNKVAKFFDPEWMFGVTNGFDIVIGNPPYISTKGITAEDKKAYEKEFGFSDDTYNLFTFKGLSLTKQGGSLTYIIPKTFWTTQTKRNMRDLLLSKNIRYIFDAANPFESVMVDTCIIQVVNTPYDANQLIHFRDGSQDLNMPIIFEPILQSMYLNTQNAVIFKPTKLNLRIWELYGEKVKALYDKWWDKIKTSKDIEKNKAELEAYRASLRPGDVALLGCLTEGGQGLATANNGKYIAIRKSSKWADNVYTSRPKKLTEAISKHPEIADYINNQPPLQFIEQSTEQQIAETFDKIKEDFGRDIFGQGYIFRLIDDSEIADVDSLTDDEKENGIDKTKPYYVPYDKGDKDGNRWYLETPFAIAWSKENVRFLKTDPKARYQGYSFFFKEVFCWNNVLNPLARLLKVKMKSASVNDVGSMSLSSLVEIVPNYYIVSLLNSNLLFDYYREQINCTVNIQINDIRQLPLIIPTVSELKEIYSLFDKAYNIKQNNPDTTPKELQEVEHIIDLKVNELYGI